MAGPEVILVGPLPPRTEAGLAAAASALHKLYSCQDRDALLAERGPHVTAVATSSFAGFSPDLFDKLPKLEIIGCFGVGVDGIPVQEAKARGIHVTNTPDVLTDDVADLALALILAVSRRICEADRYVRDGLWPQKGMMPLTRKVNGKTVGILGMGRIGAAIARRAAAFDCRIAYHSRKPKPGCPPEYKYCGSPVELARASDFLVAVCPLTDETRHIVGREVLDALGPKGTLINVARGAVVDEPELVRALAEGRVAGAGLDVFENEPEVPEELRRMGNVVLLPHVGSGTEETRGDMGDLMLANLKAHFAGEPLLTPVTE